MNPAKLKSFTPAERKAVWGCSGERLSRVAGKLWDAADKAGAAWAKKDRKNRILVADDKMAAEYFNIVSSIETKWIAKAAKKGVNGRAALADMRRFGKAEMVKEAMMMKKNKMMKKGKMKN